MFRAFWRTHSNYWGDHRVVRQLAKHLRPIIPYEDVSLTRALTALAPCLSTSVRLNAPSMARRKISYLIIPLFGVVGFLAIAWSQFVWVPHAEQASLAEWHRQTTSSGRQVKVEVVSATAIDYASSNKHRPPGYYSAIAFQYNAEGVTYPAEAIDRKWFLAHVTPRFPHVDWKKLRSQLTSSGRKTLPITVVYSVRQPRIFVVPEYSTNPPYYGVGRYFFYILRTAVLSACWVIWCVALYMLLDGLSPSKTGLGLGQVRQSSQNSQGTE
jgi:hypothetical protein